jgi:two-component system sensor histidine kinase MtrB
MRRLARLRRLSVRLAATFAVGALVVSGIVAGAAYLLTSRFLVGQQEHESLQQAYLNAATVRDRLGGQASDVPDVIDALATSSSVQTVIYQSGRWYSSSLLISRDAIPPAVRSDVVAGSVEQMWTPVAGAPRLIVGVPLPAVGAAYFQLTDESPLARTLTRLRLVLAGAAAGTTLAGAVLGWRVSRRLTRSLRAVTAASVAISAGNLNTHLPAKHDADLAGLVQSFNAMVDSLRLRTERDARFAADVSHELRSPLTTLRTSLAVLENRRAELSPPGQRALELLSGDLTRFELLVEDLLEISRSEAGVSVRPERLAIGELVTAVLAAENNRDVAVEIDPALDTAVVLGDRRRLEVVLRNLLDNARIHAGGATRVAVVRAGGKIRILVEDAGPGIPPKERKRVYERFARGRRAKRRPGNGGSGLGLALVEEHVRAQGGRTWMTGRPGGGARFVVELRAEQQ